MTVVNVDARRHGALIMGCLSPIAVRTTTAASARSAWKQCKKADRTTIEDHTP